MPSLWQNRNLEVMENPDNIDFVAGDMIENLVSLCSYIIIFIIKFFSSGILF